jgi:Ca2+-binding EF-hand superfamily protein
MAFYGLKFGETSHRHPPMKARGEDPRMFLASEIQASQLRPPPAAAHGGALVAKCRDVTPKVGTPMAHPATPERPLSAAPRRSSLGIPNVITGISSARGASAEGRRPELKPLDAAALQRPRSATSERRATAALPSSNASQARRTPVATAHVPPRPGESPFFKKPSKEEVDDVFRRIDFNGNGMLSLAELDKAVIELWPHFNNKPAIMRAYKAADRNGTGFISRKEFDLVLDYLAKYNALWNVFSAADTSGDGRLTLNEFVTAAAKIPELKDLDPVAVFKQLDTNNGGVLLFDEFCHWFVRSTVGVKSSAKAPPRVANAASVRARLAQVKTIAVPLPSTLQDAFTRVDFNGNGMLSLAELDKAVIELWPHFNNKPAIMRAYKAADRNGTGFISRKEFKTFLRYLVAYTSIFSTFAAMDQNGDRRVTESEFVDGCDLVDDLKGLAIPERREVFRSLDRNAGGVLLFDEFAAYFAAKEIANTAEVRDAAAEKREPDVRCVYCLRMRPGVHMKSCREQLQAALDTLPSALSVRIPPAPVLAIDNVPYFNDEFSPSCHKRICQLFQCPECPRAFQPGQAKAFATHFLGHNVLPKRGDQIHRDRVDGAAQLVFRPPCRPIPVQPSSLLAGHALPELFALEKQFKMRALSKEAPSVRELSRLLPGLSELVLKSLCSDKNTYDECWDALTQVPDAVRAAATLAAHRLLKLREAEALNCVDGLFDYERFPHSAVNHFRVELRKRPLQLVSLVRFLCLCAFGFESRSDFVAAMRAVT